MGIQSIILSIFASGSSSGLPENSGLKYDQFIAMGGGYIGCGTGGITGCCGCCSCLVCCGFEVVVVVVAILSR